MFLVQLLTVLSCANALFTFIRQRHYRLFEQPVDTAPMTPSARRVRVDSSPMSASPLHYLQHVISSTTASSRAYPDAEREVWQLSIWDPKPINLTLFTLFSPGHVLFYYSLLPPTSTDSRPSITVFTAITFGTLLSLQLSMLKSSFRQQAKDNALVQGQVMNEYDTKFVRPTLNRPVRDVGIQTRHSAVSPRGTRTREVDVYTPTTIVNRGFHVNPNPNYSSQYDPDNLSSQATAAAEDRRSSSSVTPLTTQTPIANGYANSYTQSVVSSRPHTASGFADHSSPLKPHHERLRDRTPARGDGGSLGVYSHAASPLRRPTGASLPRGDPSIGARVGGSPMKRTSTSSITENLARRRTERS